MWGKAAGSFGSREQGEISVGGTVVVHSWGPLCSLMLLVAFVAPFKFVKLPEPWTSSMIEDVN